jgi:hypothetical protein
MNNDDKFLMVYISFVVGFIMFIFGVSIGSIKGYNKMYQKGIIDGISIQGKLK